ncbi:uncharacterized protein RB166_020708 [Leptodactylus fuscus]
MMDRGMKTLIFLTFCALVGANSNQNIERNLEILLSVPSTHLGDTEIESAVLSIAGGHPLLYRVTVQKNETQCVNSTDPQCTSLIKEPTVDVSVTSRANNGQSFTYSETINASQQLVIRVDSVSVTPQMWNDANDKLIVVLDVLYDSSRTSLGSLRSRRNPTNVSLNVNFRTITDIQDDNGDGNGQGNGEGHGQGNGQSSLRELTNL